MAFDFKLPDIDIGNFSIELNLNQKFNSRYIKPPKNKEMPESKLKYANAEKLAQDIEISEGFRAFVVINGTFYFGDFIEALIVEKNYHVEKMTISTLSMNENNVDSLANLLNGEFVDELNLIVSDFFFSHERHKLIKYLYQECDKDNKFQLAAAGTHCKLCIIKTHCGKYIVIHGSANLRTSGNIEQFVIEENKELYLFNDEYQDEIIKEYKTINKSVRYEKLWQTINK
jgi:hypothetical protein